MQCDGRCTRRRELCIAGESWLEESVACGGLQAQEVHPEARHFNPIIRAEALGGALEQASSLITEMDNSSLGSRLAPNVESFNALLEVGFLGLRSFNLKP